MNKFYMELIKTMISPDDVLSEEDIKNIKQARLEFTEGILVRHEDIDWGVTTD